MRTGLISLREVEMVIHEWRWSRVVSKVRTVLSKSSGWEYARNSLSSSDPLEVSDDHQREYRQIESDTTSHESYLKYPEPC